MSSDILLSIARIDAVTALRIRCVCKEAKDAVDAELCWLVLRFIPNIMGLDFCREPEYYVRILRNYFVAKPEYPLVTSEPMDTFIIGHAVLRARGWPNELSRVFAELNPHLLHSVGGRAYLIEIIHKWKRCFSSFRPTDVKGTLLILMVEKVIKYAFVLTKGERLEAGRLGYLSD